MRILLNVNSNKQSGLGHFTRCLALAVQAWQRGHILAFVGDTNPRQGYISHYPANPFDKAQDVPGDGDAFTKAAKSFQPDWTIVDLPGDLPPYVGDVRGKICVIDGLGHCGNIKPDLIISQGLEGEYCAPKYLILRQALSRYKNSPKGDRWLVYGGASDEIGLLSAFSLAMTDQLANLLATKFSDTLIQKDKSHTVVRGEGDAGLGWVAEANRACIHMGMIAWELVWYKVPTWIVSRTDRHLKTALEFEQQGYAKAWGKIGLPKDNELREWLGKPNELKGESFDLDGAKRVLELMEAG